MFEIRNKKFKSGQRLLINRLNALEKRIGNTPIIELASLKEVYAKIECCQFGNSVKIRPAIEIIKKGIEQGLVGKSTTIIESTSGNFGIALAMICKFLGLKFVAVIDKNTPRQKADLLRLYGSRVVLIDQKDEYGGYLLNRIRYIENFKIANGKKCFHPDQYNNVNNPASYFIGLGQEICDYFDYLDAIVVAVSSGGTITGLSHKLKFHFPEIEVIAVDVLGSQIFQDHPHARTLSGIGSSIKSVHIESAQIDRIDILREEEIIAACQELLEEEMILGGPSSGAAYCAVKRYKRENPGKRVLFISPDNGLSYLESLYLQKSA